MKLSLVFCCFFVVLCTKMSSTLAYTPQQRTQYVLWFAECKSDYRQFEEKVRTLNRNDARVPDLRSLLKWKSSFLETGSVVEEKRTRKR
jgi:two-component SAPR family response regulator